MGATENIKEGNEDIREVMSLNNVSKIDFFLLQFSFAQVLLQQAVHTARLVCIVVLGWDFLKSCEET